MIYDILYLFGTITLIKLFDIPYYTGLDAIVIFIIISISHYLGYQLYLLMGLLLFWLIAFLSLRSIRY